MRQRKQREATGLFLVEGILPVTEAIAAGAVEYLCYAPELLTSDFARELIRKQISAGLTCYAASAPAFESMAGKENPQGIIAVARQQQTALAGLEPANLDWGVALVAPQDPGNVGAILRTINAVGAGALLLLDSSVDPFHPTAVRASTGAIFWHPIVRASFASFASWVRNHGYHVYGTSAHAHADYRAITEYRRPMILLMGSEREGLTPQQAALCQELIRLPMVGRVSSLNLAVATGIMLYSMLDRQKS